MKVHENITYRGSNNKILKIFVIVIVALHLISYVVTTLLNDILPMGRFIFGFTVFGFWGLIYLRNRLWLQLSGNQWVLLYCLYVCALFLYGFFQFRNITAAVLELWFFLFIPAIVLIPPYSINAHAFDRIMAVGVVFSSLAIVAVIVLIPETRNYRDIFQHYTGPLAALGSGAGYLFLKYSMRPNKLYYIALVGILVKTVSYGVIGAFRGQLILSFILLLLSVYIYLSKVRVSVGVKMLPVCLVIAAMIFTLNIVDFHFNTNKLYMINRFEHITDAYYETGEIAQSDDRLKEAQYFLQQKPKWKLIFGYGVGGVWFDTHGLFSATRIGINPGVRRVIHINWLHITFKIGVVGFAIMLCMLVRHYRKFKVLLRKNYGWWAFLIWYLAFTTYYGDKSLHIGSMISLFVLFHPWLFLNEVKTRIAFRRQASYGGAIFNSRSKRVSVNMKTYSRNYFNDSRSQ